ncbi:fumarylacetoacetate hydrolase [Mycobacterium sp. 852013-50091_SCH5140682]|nr:fumarylacetoacetate hydrolase [Mycobacterium sp. 852013-50091_SCH5140682]
MTATLWPAISSTIPVLGNDIQFPVRRIYCVGRNYVDHILEMKEGDERDDPFFFQKPTDALVSSGDTVNYPPETEEFEFEGELVVAIGAEGSAVSAETALDLVYGYAAGVDLTRRDRQRECRAQMRPWEAGKSFDHSAPCGVITPAGGWNGNADSTLTLSVNGVERQRTTLGLMIWNVPEIIVQLSRQYVLKPGDLIYTGTPAGVGTLTPGDIVTVRIDGLQTLTFSVD